MADRELCYVKDLVHRLRQEALEAAAGEDDFERGRAFGFAEVLSIMQNMATACDLPVEEILLDGLDPFALVARTVRQGPDEGRQCRINPRDYVTTPRDTGYRAVHLIVVKHGLRVEVQVRTGLQHSWAMIVEGLEERTGEQLKDNQGPLDLLQTLQELAEAFARVDSGDVSPDTIRGAQALLSRLQRA